MATKAPAYFWEADVELEIKNLAFSVSEKDEGRGAYKKRIFYADWLRDGKIYWNPAQRVKGWINKNLPLVKSTYKDQIQAVKVFPFDGQGLWEAIAEAKDMIGVGFGEDSKPEDNMDYSALANLPYPHKQHITVKDAKGGVARSVPLYWLVLPGPINIKVKVMSFARSIEPEMIEEALRELGKATGLGDKHNHGFGGFELKGFKSEKKRLKL